MPSIINDRYTRGTEREYQETLYIRSSSLAVGVRKNVYALVPVYEVPETTEVKAGEFIPFAVLANAIQQGDLKNLEEYLKSEPEMIEYFDIYTGTSFIHIATKNENPELWKILREHKAFVNHLDQEDFRGTTALLAACWYENILAVETLVEFGANPTKGLRENKKTILHLCATQNSSEICSAVLKDHRSTEVLDRLDFEGNTALAIAIKHKSPTIDCLVAAGANLLTFNPFTGRNNFHVAIVFGNYDFLKFLLAFVQKNYPQELAIRFVNETDKNKDSPLKLALKLADAYSITSILNFHASEKVLQNVREALHSLVIGNKRQVLNAISDYAADPSFYDIYDSEGRTPLLIAIEYNMKKIIAMLQSKNVSFETLNLYTGDSVLHVAAYAHEEMLIKMILRFVNYNNLSLIENNLGLTAYEIILGNANFQVWSTWRHFARVEKTFENSSEESALFIAAKEGNYRVVLAELLSEKFYNYHEIQRKIDEESFLHLEAMRMVYSSDVFIALGLVPGQRGWETSPKQEHLFKRNAKGMNIFHACALGGNIDCLIFLNNYCRIFKNNHWQLDEGDDNENTPLFYAAYYGYTELIRYFLLHGCSLCHTNTLGWAPIHSIIANEKCIDILDDVVSKCAKYAKMQELAIQHFQLSYKLFQADKDDQMKVIATIFDNLTSDEYIKILTNPVIEYFILYKWTRIKSTASFKLFIHVMMVCSFSLFMSFKFCDILQTNSFVKLVFQWFTICFACLLFLTNLPMLFVSKSHCLIYLAIPLMVLTYMGTSEHTRESIELGAVAVVLSWLTMIIESHATKLSYQIAVLLKTLHAVVKLAPLIIIVLTAFSLCFFTLFHEYYEYNNPLHAFLTLAAHMREGNMKVPALPLQEEMEPLDTSHEAIFPPQYSNSKTLNTKVELRSILVEGCLLLFFRLFVIICAYNLLVDEAIKGVTEVESMGKLQKLKIYVDKLVYWENLLNSKMYKTLSTLNIAWLIGLPNSLREYIRIPVEVHTMYSHVPDFEISSLKWIIKEKENETTMTKYFNDITEEEDREKSFNFKKSVRKGSLVSSANARMRGYSNK